MKCPSCHTIVPGPVPQCPTCRLSLRRLDVRFGAVPRHTRFLTDHTGRLRTRELAELRQLLRLFGRKFPQSAFSVFLTNQVPDGAVAEYTFWLANRVRFGRVNAIGSENFDLLLGIDTETSSAALVAGYGLENYVSERDLERALAQASSGF